MSAPSSLPRSPIFIGGLSYSGKTQLRIIVGAHADICMTRRTYMWDRFYGRFGDLGVADNLHRCLDVMCADRNVAQLDPERARIEAELASMRATYANLFGLFHRHHAERAGARRWGDQLGFVERFADPIFDSEPDARMIHMIRDPRVRTRATARKAYTGALGWETARWIRSAELAERNQRRYPDRYLVVRYEELERETAACVARVLEFLGERGTTETDAAIESVSFDRNRCDPGASRFVDRHAGDVLVTFGYASRTGGVNGTATSGDPDDAAHAIELARRAADLVGMKAWRVLKDRPFNKRSGVGA